MSPAGPAVSPPPTPQAPSQPDSNASFDPDAQQRPSPFASSSAQAGPSRPPQTALPANGFTLPPGLTDQQGLQRFLLAQQAIQAQQRATVNGSPDAATQPSPDYAAMAKAVGGVPGLQGASKDAIMKQASSFCFAGPSSYR